MNETKLVCPVCGTEFAIPEKTYQALVQVLGKYSNLGIIHPLVAGQHNPEDRAQQRIETLANAGVQGNFYSVNNSTVSASDADDAILNGIVSGGTVPNRNLFRRWVMAQVFRGLDSEGGFVNYIHHLGYKYQWRMLIEELRVQARMELSNAEELSTRQMFFNKDVVLAVVDHYLDNLDEHISNAKQHTCKGRPYKNILGKNIFVNEIEMKVVNPLREKKRAIFYASSKGELYGAVSGFWRMAIHTRRFRQCPEWMDAYKGAGAFYTMKNMLLFHDCFIINDGGTCLYKEIAVDFIMHKAQEYKGQGWSLFGMLRKMLNDNNIDVSQMRKSWRK